MRRSTSSERRVSILRRTASEVRHYRVMMKALTVMLALISVSLATVYLSAALYKETGSFTVGIDKYQMEQYGLTLSESSDMTHKSSHLNAKISESITNISGNTIPENVGAVDGANNGDNYIAYTFYASNGGATDISYEYSVKMSNVSNDLDDAIRLRLYVNDVPTTYAKVARDGNPEPGTEAFLENTADGGTIMARGRIDEFAPGDVTKFTVVLWIEGNDPECLDNLIGGELKVDMFMEVIH